jgi:hypothetical protein
LRAPGAHRAQVAPELVGGGETLEHRAALCVEGRGFLAEAGADADDGEGGKAEGT